MSQRKIRQRTVDEMRAAYPIEGRVEGWFFRVRETSNNAWLVEGSDAWGRTVSRDGGDPEALLAKCIEDAQAIRAQLSAKQ
jgi:hypothetical protein